MNIQPYAPSAALRPFVQTFLLVESTAAASNRVLPDTALVLAFRCRGSVAVARAGGRQGLPASVITGLKNASQTLHYGPATTTLLVLFTAGGAAAFFREPLHELFGSSEPLDGLVHRRELSEIEEQLAEAPAHAQRVAIIERFLLRRLAPPPARPLVQQAVRAIVAGQGGLRIKDLAARLASSQDALEKQFRRVVGVSPKQFASIVRLRWVLAHYQAPTSLTELAHAAGYFDQAHFNKEFKAFTGQAPKAFFAGEAYW